MKDNKLPDIPCVAIWLCTLLCFTLYSCKTTKEEYYTLRSISPHEDYSVFRFKNGRNRIKIIEKAEKYNFNTKLKLIEL